MLLSLTEGMPLAMDVSLMEIATKTAAFVKRDLAAMVAHASMAIHSKIIDKECVLRLHSSPYIVGLGISRVLESQATLNKVGYNGACFDPKEEKEIVDTICDAGITICAQDFAQSIQHIQSQHTSSVAAPKVSDPSASSGSL